MYNGNVWGRKTAEDTAILRKAFNNKVRKSFLESPVLEGSTSRGRNCHDNTVVERFFQYLMKPTAIFLIESKFFITVNIGMAGVISCHQLRMLSNITNGSEFSNESGVFHNNAIMS